MLLIEYINDSLYQKIHVIHISRYWFLKLHGLLYFIRYSLIFYIRYNFINSICLKKIPIPPLSLYNFDF